MRSYHRSDDLGRAIIEEQVYASYKYRWIIQFRREAADIARRMLVEAALPERYRRENFDKRLAKLSEKAGLEWKRERRAVVKEVDRNFRVDGSVLCRYDVVKKGLVPLPSAEMNERERSAREADIRREFLKRGRAEMGGRIGTDDGPEEGVVTTEARWVQANLWVRIEFEGNREIFVFGLDNPTAEAVKILGEFHSAFTVHRGLELAGSRHTGAIDKALEGTLIPQHREALEEAKIELRRDYERQAGRPPQKIDPELDYFPVYDPYGIYQDAIIAQARRDLGVKFEEAAANELALLAEHDEVFDPTLQRLAEEKAARAAKAEGAGHGHDAAPATQPEG